MYIYRHTLIYIANQIDPHSLACEEQVLAHLPLFDDQLAWKVERGVQTEHEDGDTGIGAELEDRNVLEKLLVEDHRELRHQEAMLKQCFHVMQQSKLLKARVPPDRSRPPRQ